MGDSHDASSRGYTPEGPDAKWPEAVFDIDGNRYRTVRIGHQVWMAENLKVSRYRNGDPILNVTSGQQWRCLKTGAYANYANAFKNGAIYGRLYNWHAVNDSRQIAPQGWHVPGQAEWEMLVDFLGGCEVAGGKMKKSVFWRGRNPEACNESGFSALPGGFHHRWGEFHAKRRVAYFWCSTEDDLGGQPWAYRLLHDSSSCFHFSYRAETGMSVRCIKDSFDYLALLGIE